MRHIVGVGILGGIGFTMSILIAGLAFTEIPAELLAAKTAILAGSVSAALIGSSTCISPAGHCRRGNRKRAMALLHRAVGSAPSMCASAEFSWSQRRCRS